VAECDSKPSLSWFIGGGRPLMMCCELRMVWRLPRIALFTGLLVMSQSAPLSAGDDDSSQDDPSGVSDVVRLDESELRESSGLAVSNQKPNHFWTHNDSGKEGKLYAFDDKGRKSGHIKFKSAKMNDWEDIASFLDDGVPRLLIADSGDNKSKRSEIRLHLFDEPDPTDKSTLKDKEVQTIRVTYPDGPRDCEAVAVDVERGSIVLISKTKLPYCGVYTMPLPRRAEELGDHEVTVTRVTSLAIPMITAMDIDPATGDLWIVSYFHTFCYRCPDRDMPFQVQLGGLPESYELPRWKQIEAVAIDRTQSIWVTSEGKRTPLGRLSPDALSAQSDP
jgi:hypothetical protein